MCSITRMMKTSFCLNYHKSFAISLKKIYHVLVKRHAVPTASIFNITLDSNWSTFIERETNIAMSFFIFSKNKYGYWYFHQYCSYEAFDKVLSSITFLILTKKYKYPIIHSNNTCIRLFLEPKGVENKWKMMHN